jgi:large subunit ribosomal protein L3
MSRAILGKKLGMTQIFDEAGNCIQVTVVEAGPCHVMQKKTVAKHKYSAIQIGFEQAKNKSLNKPDRGMFEKLDIKPLRYLREVRLTSEEVSAYNIGDQITVSIFETGEEIDVIGTSKGRGFQGVVKKYGFAGNTKTRGTHEHRRHPGSIGNCEWPGKVFKGHRLPGQMGNKRVTTQNVRIVKIDEAGNRILIRGSVPGARGGLVMIRKAIKRTANQRT